MTRFLETMLALSLTLAGVAGPAGASPPCECPYLTVLPPPGATNVPTNVRIFVPQGGFTADDVRLALSSNSSETVAVSLESAGGTLGETWVVPAEDLEPRTAYTLALPVPPGTLSFTTGSEPDRSAPRFSWVDIAPGGLPGACADHVAAQVDLDGLRDDRVPTRDVIVRVTVTSSAADEPVREVYLTGDLGTFGTFADPSWTSCLDNFPDADPSATYQATVTALDWSGNRSVEAPVDDFFFGWDKSMVGCMCSATGEHLSSDWGAGLLIAGGLVILFRRRLAAAAHVLFRKNSASGP